MEINNQKFTISSPADVVTCSEDFVLHNNFCYQYFGHSHRPFHHAEKFCSHHKSSLVSIHSLQEEEFVVQLAENNTSFWIGLNDEDGPASYHEEGVFKWTDGNVLTDTVFQNWRLGEPNNRRHLDCVKTSYKGWAMAQGGCAASRLPFVCKKQGMLSTGTITTSPNWHPGLTWWYGHQLFTSDEIAFILNLMHSWVY